MRALTNPVLETLGPALPADAMADAGKPVDACSIHWMLSSSSVADEISAIRQQVDRIFEGFSFYPEIESRQYRFRPPEGREIFGCWRHPKSVAFVFLTDNPGMIASSGTKRLILSYDGERSVLTPLLPQVRRLKRGLAQQHRRSHSEKQLNVRLPQADASASVKRLGALMAPITAAITALALYLQKLPPPKIQPPWLSNVYQVLLPLVYIAALVLVFAFSVICALYICKFGFLLLRRL